MLLLFLFYMIELSHREINNVSNGTQFVNDAGVNLGNLISCLQLLHYTVSWIFKFFNSLNRKKDLFKENSNYFLAVSIPKLRFKTKICNDTNIQNGMTFPEWFTSWGDLKKHEYFLPFFLSFSVFTLVLQDSENRTFLKRLLWSPSPRH